MTVRRFASDTRLRVAATLLVLVVLTLVVLPRGGTARADYDSDCATPTVTYTAATMPASLNLTSADVVLLASGTFSGSVNSNLGTICVAAGAVYAPSSVNGTSRVFVRGTATVPQIAAGNGALLDNEGTVTFNSAPNTNGVTDVFNRAGGTITVMGSNLSLGPDVVVVNDGVIDVQGSLNQNGSSLTNNGEFTVGGPYNVAGDATNTGSVVVNGTLTVNGNGTLVNDCSLTATGLINDNSTTNNGVIDLGGGELLNNSGVGYVQGEDAITVGATFTNPGAVSGSGQYLFSGQTATQGSMVGNSPADPIVFYDTSQTGGQILDVENGTITNVVREVVTAPDPGVCNVAPPVTTTTDVTTTDVTTTDVTTTDVTTTEVTTTDVTTTAVSTTDVTTTDVSTTDVTTTDVTTTDATPSTTDPGGSTIPLTPTTSIDAGAGAGGGSLPSTGSDGLSTLLPFAIALLACGAVAAFLARRPTRPTD